MKQYKNADEFLDDYMNNPICDEPGMCQHLKRAFEAGQNSNRAETVVMPKIALMVSVNKTSKVNGKKFNQFSHYIGYDRDKLEKYLLEKYKIQNLIKDIADEFPYFTDGGFRYTAENDNWQYEFVCHPYNVIE